MTATSLLIVCAVLLGFFALWCHDLGYPALSSDEAFAATLASRPLVQILQRLNYDEPHPPLYYLALHFWVILTGSGHEFVLRYLSVLVGVLLLSLTYRLGQGLGNGWLVALICVIWLGFNPQIVVHVREVRMYGFMLVGVALAALAALRFHRLPVWMAIVAGLIALLTHYFNVFFVGALGIWGIIVLRGTARRRWILAQTAIWVLFATWLPVMGRGFFSPASLSQGKTWSLVLLPWETLATVIKVGLVGYREAPHALWVILGGGLLMIAWLGAVFSSSLERRWFALLTIALPLGAYSVMCAVKPVFHPKYVLPWLLFVALAMGCAMQRWRYLGGTVAALLLLMAVPTWRTLQRPYDPGLNLSPDVQLTTSMRELGQYVVRYAGPSDTFGLNTPDPAFCYYVDGYFDRALGCQLLPASPEQTLAELESEVAGLFEHYSVLWFLDYHNPYWDPNQLAETVLNQRYLLLGTEETGIHWLRLYTSPEIVREAQYPVGATFGGLAELEGVWVAQGRALYPVLVWRSLVDFPPQEAKVFVHMVDEDGRIVCQSDGVPVQWTRPLETWRLDEQLLDAQTLSCPPGIDPVHHTLRIGLYDPETMERFPVNDRTGISLAEDFVSIPLGILLH